MPEAAPPLLEHLVTVKKPKPSMLGKIRNTLLEMLPQNSAAETEDLHKGGWAIPIVLVKQVAFVVVLLVYTVLNTQKEMGKRFLSLDTTSPSQTCVSVANPLVSRFYGDRYGRWESEPGYDFSGEFYSIKFSGADVSDEQYLATMKKFDSSLQQIGEISTRRDLAYTILALSSWSKSDHETKIEFTTNADVSEIFGNFELVEAALYSANGKARNVPGAMGGGVGGYTFSMSQDKRSMLVSFPLSQCTMKSQVEAMRSSFNANSTVSGVLSIGTASATLYANTFNKSTDYIALAPAKDGGSAKNNMEVTWTDESYNPDKIYMLEFCGVNAMSQRGSGHCRLRTKASFVSLGTVNITDSTVVQASPHMITVIFIATSKDEEKRQTTVVDGMTVFGDSSLNNVVFKGHSGSGGEYSTTLTVESTTKGTVGDNMVFSYGGVYVLLRGCQVASGAGTCVMSTTKKIPSQTVLYGSTVTVGSCKLDGDFDASNLPFTITGTPTSTSIDVSVAAGSYSPQDMLKGGSFSSSDKSWTIVSCTWSGTAGTAGTCTISGGSSTAPSAGATVLTNKIFISRTSDGGEVVDGMSFEFGVNSFALSGCKMDTTNGSSPTFGQGSCKVSSVLRIPSGTTIQIKGSGKCALYVGDPSNGELFNPTSTIPTSSRLWGYANENVTLSLGTVFSGVARTSPSLYAGFPLANKMAVMGGVISDNTVLSNCHEWVDPFVVSVTGVTASAATMNVSSSSVAEQIVVGDLVSAGATVVSKVGRKITLSNNFATTTTTSTTVTITPPADKPRKRSCDRSFVGATTIHSAIIKSVKDPTGQTSYTDLIGASNWIRPNVGMLAICDTPGCGIPDNSVVVAINTTSSEITLSKKLTKNDTSIRFTLTGLTSENTVINGEVGTFSFTNAKTVPSSTLQSVGGTKDGCVPVKLGVPGFFDPAFFDPQDSLSYNNFDGKNVASISLNMNSISTAASANLGIIDVSSLAPVNVSNPQSFAAFKYGSFYVDHNFVPMDPVFCLKKGVKSPVCLVSIKNRLFYPALLTVSPKDGSQCRCRPEGFRSASTSAECDLTPVVIVALISFPNDLSDSGRDMKDGSGNKRTVTFAKAMSQLFLDNGGSSGNGDLAVIDYLNTAINSVYTNRFTAGQYTGFESACDIASTGLAVNQNCVMLLAEFLVSPDQFMTVNAPGTQLTALQTNDRLHPIPSSGDDDISATSPASFFSVTCTNAIYIPSAMNALKSKPPVPLVQPYSKCSSTLITSVQVALGSAAGSAGLYTGIVVSILLSIAVSGINAKLKKKGEDPLLPPLKKAQKNFRDTASALDALRNLVEKLLDLQHISPQQREALRQEFRDQFHALKADEERVPLVQAKAENLEIIHSTDSKILSATEL